MKSKVVLHGNPYFLQDSHYTAMTMAIETNSALAVDEDGEKILKAGTVYPSNDASALGIVLKDVILDAEKERFTTFSLITHGHIDEDLLPAKVNAAAKTALNNIVFSSEHPSSGVPAEMFVLAQPASPTVLTVGKLAKGATISGEIKLETGFTFDHALVPADVCVVAADLPLICSAVDSGSNSVTFTVTRDVFINAGSRVGVVLNAGSIKETPFSTNMVIVAKTA